MPFDEERRTINLGGTSTFVSLAQALDAARLQRLNRENDRKRNKAALKLQTWWRRIQAQRITQTQCRLLFDADPSTLIALRSLIFLHNDVDRICLWSTTMIKDDGLLLLKRLTTDERASWLILIRQLTPRLLKFMADTPSSPFISTHLQLMTLWLSPTDTCGLGSNVCDSERSSAISYILKAGYYKSLAKVITFARKSFEHLPHLFELIILPLRLLQGSSDTDSYLKALLHFAIYVIPIPQLASRLTKPILRTFAVDIGLFLANLASLAPLFPLISSQITLRSSIHSLSNLMCFTPPRYSQLSTPSYDAYLCLVRMLMNHVPEVILHDSDDAECKDSWIELFPKSHTDVPIDLDSRTRDRINSILSNEHISRLLKAADCPTKLFSLATYLPQFSLSWPSQVRKALNALVNSDLACFIRVLYIGKVSNIALGKSLAVKPVAFISAIEPEHWATLLFFVDLFILLNQQMNDEEFYATTSDMQSDPKLRNPLEVGQLKTLLKQLCIIVYALDQLLATGTHIPATKGKMNWEGLTARLKESLVILYCREVRRPLPQPKQPWFPPGMQDEEFDDEEKQWTKKAREDMESFITRADQDRDNSPRNKILRSDPTYFDEITAFLNSANNVRMFRYFPWPRRIPPQILFPHLLGNYYLMRFERTEDEFNPKAFPNLQDHQKWRRDLCNQIVQCYEAALDLAWSTYPAKADLLQKLAFMLLWRFEVKYEIDDCRRAFDYLQNAFHLDSSLQSLKRTINIGQMFLEVFLSIAGFSSLPHTGEIETSSLSGEGICSYNPEKLVRDLVVLGDHVIVSLIISAAGQNATRTGHNLEKLAKWYKERYKCRGRSEDLDDAIVMWSEAFKQEINNPPPPTSGLPAALRPADYGWQLIECLKLRYDMHHTKEDLETLRNLLLKMVTSYCGPGHLVMLQCAVLFSQLPSPPKLPYAFYDRAIFSLHVIQGLNLTLGSLDTLLRFHDTTLFIGNIVGMALRENNLVKALEWLENSRCLVWSHLSSLEDAPVSLDLERRGLGQNKIAFRMSQALKQDLLKSTFVDGNQILNNLIDDDGPVILLNASSLGCHALVYIPNIGLQLLPLTSLSYDRVSAWGKAFTNLLSDIGASVRGDERKDRPSKRSTSNDDKFQSLLEEIWVSLVEPVLNFVCDLRSENGPPPRLWWCRTGPFSLLPIHAAGLYTLYGPQIRLSDFTASSYIPSISSIKSRTPIGPPADFKLLVIAQPSTPGLLPLPGAQEEVSNIKKQSRSLPTVVLTHQEATRAVTIEEAASAPWVHAACHGIQRGAYSSFSLHDGSLSLNHLASLPNLSKVEFAFLSACETATGDGQLSGEALHLAGGFSRIGYRSVIATLFAVRDRDAPFVADKVYEQLFEDERPNYRKAAQALRHAIHLLQEENGRGNFRSWVPFIHTGM